MREQRQESWRILSCQRSLKSKLGCTKDLCCHLLFLQLWYMLALNLPEVALSELLYADNLVLMSDTIEGLRDKFIKWKEAFERKGLKVSLGKTKVMVVVVVDPTPPTCCQQSPAPESCGSQQSLPPGGKERLHFVGIRPDFQARKGGW